MKNPYELEDYERKRYVETVLERARKFIIHSEHPEAKQQSLKMLHFVESVVQEDLCSSYISAPFYGEEIANAEKILNIIPLEYYDEKNIRHEIQYSELRDFYLNGHNFICAPSEVDKIANVAKIIDSESFRYDDTNHFCNYYDGINFAVIFNGNHSVAAGHVLGTGKVKAFVYNIRKMFPHIYTNGVHWYNSHTNEIISEADDFRICALYELAKLRNINFG